MPIAHSRDRKPLPPSSPRPGRDPATPKPKPEVVSAAPAPAPPKPKPKPKPEPKPEPKSSPPPPPEPTLEIDAGVPAPPVQRQVNLPVTPLTRADVPAGAKVHLGHLRHGIDPWSGRPYVFLLVKGLGRFGWRHTWGLDPDAVTYQHPDDAPVKTPVWVAPNLESEKARQICARILNLSIALKAAWTALKPTKDPREDPA